MKKLFLALLVTVMSFTVYAKFNASAAELNTGYSWVDQYATDGKTVLIPNNKTDFVSYGYSGVDIKLGDYVMPLAGGQVFVPDANMSAPGGLGWASLAAAYINTSATDTWYIPRTNASGFFMLFIDKDGKVYDIINSYFELNGDTNFTPTAGQLYNVYWDSVANQRQYVGGALTAPKLSQTHQLKYGELGTTWHWLTKADVDKDVAEGVTLADTDSLYMTADGKYTNVSEGNTPVMTELKGYEIPAGGTMLSLQYLDKTRFAEQVKPFSLLVDGTSRAQVVEHDVTAPVFWTVDATTGKEIVKSFPTTYKLAQGLQYNPIDGVTAKDTGLLTTVGDETTPAVTMKYQKLNPTTGLYEDTTALDSSAVGVKFKVIISASDTSTARPTPNTATRTITVEITAANLPIITGLEASKIVNSGVTVDLLAGLTVDDGYGHDITPQLQVFYGNFNASNPQPGVYQILYFVQNSFNALTLKTMVVNVLDVVKPVAVVYNNHVVIEKNADYDLLSNVFATDNYSKVSYTLLDDGGFDNTYPDTYTIQVRVSDEAGNKVTVTYELEVVEKDLNTRVANLESDLAALADTLDSKDAALKASLNELDALLDALDTATDANLTALEAEIQTKLDDLTNTLTEAQGNIDGLDSTSTSLFASINDLRASLQSQIDAAKKANTDLGTTVDSLTSDTKEKDQNALVLSVVVGVVALAGVGVAGFSLKRK